MPDIDGVLGTPESAERGVGSCLITADQLSRRARELGSAIDNDFSGRNPIVLVVLQGALVFAADLIREISGHLELASVAVSSYPTGTARSQEPVIRFETPATVSGRHVIVVEDIVDTGHTLHALLARLSEREPASLTVATCLDKPARRELEIPLHYVGFEVPPVFVVGYGLDWSGRYRNLPYVGVLDESALEGIHASA